MTPVERAAEVLYTPRWDSHGHPTWADVDHGVKEEYRKDARAALTAALDVDELAAVLQQATDDGADRTEDYALAVVAHLTKGNENDE